MRVAAAVAAALLLLAATSAHQVAAGPRNNASKALRLLTAAGVTAPWAQAADAAADDNDDDDGGGANAATAPSVRNAAGKPLLTPEATWIKGHKVYYEAPAKPKGLLIILHKCGRSASDHWPRSVQCPECSGLPESLSKTKQALARGYAVAAMDSLDRSTGGGGRCFSWASDAKAAAEAVRQLPAMLGVPAGGKVFLNGASSGGSLALRLPGIAEVDGVIGEVIAPPGMPELLAEGMARDMPPAVYIHMPVDAGMAAKVADNLAALRQHNIPVAEIKVWPRPVTPRFFSDRSVVISPALSVLLHKEMRKMGLTDGSGRIKVDPKNVVWNGFRSFVKNDLGPLLSKLKPAQREQDTSLITAHVWECVGLAWASHETVGEYTTAALAWLESGGAAKMSELAKKLRQERPALMAVGGPSSSGGSGADDGDSGKVPASGVDASSEDSSSSSSSSSSAGHEGHSPRHRHRQQGAWQ